MVFHWGTMEVLWVMNNFGGYEIFIILIGVMIFGAYAETHRLAQFIKYMQVMLCRLHPNRAAMKLASMKQKVEEAIWRPSLMLLEFHQVDCYLHDYIQV